MSGYRLGFCARGRRKDEEHFAEVASLSFEAAEISPGRRGLRRREVVRRLLRQLRRNGGRYIRGQADRAVRGCQHPAAAAAKPFQRKRFSAGVSQRDDQQIEGSARQHASRSSGRGLSVVQFDHSGFRPARRRAGNNSASRVDLPSPCPPTISPRQPFSRSRRTIESAFSPSGKMKGIAPGRMLCEEKGLWAIVGSIRRAAADRIHVAEFERSVFHDVFAAVRYDAHPN